MSDLSANADSSASTTDPPPPAAAGAGRVTFGDFAFDPDRQELSRGGAPIALTPKSLALLLYFLSHPQRVLAKDELITAIWGAVVVTDDSLVQCVKDLRGAMEDKEQKLIRTLPRRGYMFDSLPLPLPAPSTAAPLAAMPAAGSDPRGRSPRRWAWWWAGVVVLALMALLAGRMAWERSTAPPSNIDEEIKLRRALAVLAFTDQRGRATGSTLGDDLADAIGAQLVRGGSRVIGRAATVRQDAAAPEFERIGHEQGVRFVIGGRINRERGAIRVDTYLTEIATGAVYRLHEVQFQNDEAVGFAAFGREVALALQARFYELETAHTWRAGGRDDPVDAIALAWRELDQGNSEAALMRARYGFELAARADPRSVQAAAGVGATDLVEFYGLHSNAPGQTLEHAEQALKRALDLAPDDPQSLTAWAEMLLLRNQPDVAIWLWQKAIGLDPDFQIARLRLAHGLVRQGRYNEAAQQLAQVTDLRPYQMRRLQALSQARADLAFAQGHDDEAYEILSRWAAESPNNGKPQLMLAAIDALHQRSDAAAAHMARHRQLLPRSTVAYVLMTYPSSNPDFLAQRARLIDGARKAGLPEGAP
ncbi:MAG: winged helix-turn-helix domain-containing protein [Proteobacteria bacterium]|nr:winged helix-turn-helix domain-containing protein [Pseudomonadota bacterium]